MTDAILRLHGFAALALVFLIPALEASAFVGFLFPGEIAVLLGGVLAFQGRAPLWAVIVAAVLGAAIGDSIGYAVGKRWGRSLLHGTLGRLPIIRRELDKHLDRAQEYVRRRGPHAVFVGRFTAALRVLVPGLAGMAGVPYGSFVTFNVLGAIIWGTGFALLGFFAGAAWQRVAGIAGWVGLGLLLLVLLGLLGARFARAARERGQTVADRLAALPPARWLRLRLPAQATWLAGRVDPSRPTGFPLSVSVMAGVIAAWLFGGMLQDVVAREEAVRFDPGVLRWFVEHRVGWITGFMRGATWLGSNAVVIPVAAILAAAFVVRRRSYRPLVQLAAAVVSSILLYDAVKVWVHRPRPPIADRRSARARVGLLVPLGPRDGRGGGVGDDGPHPRSRPKPEDEGPSGSGGRGDLALGGRLAPVPRGSLVHRRRRWPRARRHDPVVHRRSLPRARARRGRSA